MPEILAALERSGLEAQVFETKGPGHARELLDQARQLDLPCVAVVGGDGTLNEVSQAYLGSDGEPLAGPDLALIPSGTGWNLQQTDAANDKGEIVGFGTLSGSTRGFILKPID